MNTNINTESISEEVIISNSPIYRWSRLVSYYLFTYSTLFFVSSFIIFFIKRTNGTDPHMVSGAYPGTIQLLVFTLAFIASLFTLLLGYYLYRFSEAYENIDEDYLGSEMKGAVKNMEKYLRLLGTGLVASLGLILIALVIYFTK